MTRTTRAVVHTGLRTLELQELPLPSVGDDDGLLRIDRCGICGTDVERFAGVGAPNYPVVPGHEPVGVIEEIGAAASERWGVVAGDRVVVEARIPCGRCASCRSGKDTLCTYRYSLGTVPLSVPPSLWGGFAEHMYLHPNSRVHKIDHTISLDVAATFNALAGGLSWAKEAAATEPGETVVILGAGQRGLTSLIGAKVAGAGTTVITGLGRDGHKLRLADELGADLTVDVDVEDVVERVTAYTNGELADVVMDLVPYATETVVDAVRLAKHGGRIILAGLKGDRAVQGLQTDDIVWKGLTVRGVVGKGGASFREAIELMQSGAFPLERLHTHTFPLDEAERAIRVLAGEVAAEAPICVSVAAR